MMYIAAIVAANLLVVAFGPAVSVLNAVVFIGLDLTTRDALHEQWRGRGVWWRMAALIAAGSVVSWLLNINAGPIALASLVAFAAAGAADALFYQLLGDRAALIKINGSNLIAAGVDSLVFAWLAFGAWLPLMVLGQFAAKVVGGYGWSLILVQQRRELA